jgi:hypothetical protein
MSLSSCLRAIPGRARIAIASTAAAGAAATLVMLPAVPAQASAWRPPVLVGCQGGAHVRPRHYVIDCADAGAYLTRMHWGRWHHLAVGHGNEWVNNCKPNCAAGRFYRYRTNVVLWRAMRRPHHRGQRYFSRMTIYFLGRVPAGFRRRETIMLLPHA